MPGKGQRQNKTADHKEEAHAAVSIVEHQGWEIRETDCVVAHSLSVEVKQNHGKDRHEAESVDFRDEGPARTGPPLK
jgi:hypothetical protein